MTRTTKDVTTLAGLIGRTIHYTGDVANAPRTGFIANVFEDRWGVRALVIWDESEALGWDGDEAVRFENPTTELAAHQIVSHHAARPGDRFVVAD